MTTADLETAVARVVRCTCGADREPHYGGQHLAHCYVHHRAAVAALLRETLNAALDGAADLANFYPNRHDLADEPPSLQYGCDEIAGAIRALKVPA